MSITDKASFEEIRYGQVWEDADVLCAALAPKAGGRFLSICSAGDNALALLTLDPKVVVAVDFSPAQIACLKLRMAAYRALDHGALLELMGSRPSARREALLDEVLREADPDARRFWEARRDGVVAHGLAGIGKFERYFRIFQRYLLPLAHSRGTVTSIFEPRSPEGREEFLDRVWNSWRWRTLLKVFFSRWAMGRLGRDPAFFDHVEGSVSDHVARRIRQAFVGQDPARNPYLRWLMTGTHGEALPLALRPEHFDTIRSRLDRIVARVGSVTEGNPEGAYDGFNLSDIFEYMSPHEFEAAYAKLLAVAAPKARLAYWNMMAPRARPAALAHAATPLEEESERLHAADKAFFYAAFRVDETAP
jgi:S-adenosylmethionine-diacylglycerol 3-amino-3-carboxypropyl transferase